MFVSEYRTHLCSELRDTDVGKIVKLSGWLHNRRDHGGILFLELRDNYGITQIVIEGNLDRYTLLTATAVHAGIRQDFLNIVSQCAKRDEFNRQERAALEAAPVNLLGDDLELALFQFINLELALGLGRDAATHKTRRARHPARLVGRVG